jgi:hypothetical protein
MSIGKTGKRAQQLGKSRLQRHHVKAGDGDSTPLRPLQKGGQTPAKPVEAPVIQRQDDDAPAASNTSAAQSANVPEPPGDEKVSPEKLADMVYELMKKDLRIESERFGRLRRKS